MANYLNYNLSEEQYKFMVESQNGCCAICGKSGELVIDHCHTTGRIRKLLCRNCNLALGLLGDNPKIIRKAACYIEDTEIEIQTRELLDTSFVLTQMSSKEKMFESVYVFIEDYLSKYGVLPNTQPIMNAFDISQSGAYYMMVRYIVTHGNLLVTNGIIDQAKLDKALVAFEKMPKGKKI